MVNIKNLLVLLVIVSLLLISYCGGDKREKIELIGAGATFPYPLYSKIFSEYHKNTGVKVNYQAIGSGGGIRQLKNKTVDFGGTDAFMSDEELKDTEGTILHIPTCIGAVVITYNLEGNPTLKFTPDVIADIFLGKITKWNDPRIVEINPDVILPNIDITIVHRSDGSGTTFIFSDYLSKVSAEWKAEIGTGKSLNWTIGLGGKGNPGVAGLIKQIPGGIGYIELIYALQNDMPVALVKNKKGNFIEPSLESTTLAVQTDIPLDTRVSITNTDADMGYPISSFTWLIFYQEQNYDNRGFNRAKALVDLLWWIIHEGQQYPAELDYAPLPEIAVKKSETILKTVTCKGKKIIE
jgi:phosphate transport system substrate-binding protein